LNKKIIECKLLDEFGILPEYKTLGSSGFDICANKDYILKPQSVSLIKTSISFIIKSGYEVQIRSRSGLALKGISVFNSPGTIDSDYEGEIGILLFNSTNKDFDIKAKDRIAQGILANVIRAGFADIKEINRGDSGFGSTGIQ